MAGRTLLAKYQRDDDTIGSVRVGAGTVTTWNPVATGDSVGYRIKARGSKRAYGVVARSVSLARNVGTAAAYSSSTVNVTVPMFTKAAWSALGTGTILTYQGQTDWIVTGTNAEESK